MISALFRLFVVVEVRLIRVEREGVAAVDDAVGRLLKLNFEPVWDIFERGVFKVDLGVIDTDV